MFIFENLITLEKRELLEKYLGVYEYKTSGLSFSALYMWRDINKFCFQEIGDYLCISGMSHLESDGEEPFMFPPLTKTGGYEPKAVKETLEKAKAIFNEKGFRFSVRLMPAHMIDIIEGSWGSGVEIIEDRPNFDYVYLAEDLKELKGRSYHAKKNHLNFFKNNYSYEYRPLTSDMAPTAMQFIKEFNARKEVPEHEMKLLLMEEEAMQDVFKNIEAVDYMAGAIMIDDKIEAISIGGRLGKETITVHVEKANIGYRGLYQAINNEFCLHIPDDIVYVNREEDMGLLNLRKAKLSYKPVTLVEKYIALFK